jgi:nucleoside-diphosphate-sugar epimerase
MTHPRMLVTGATGKTGSLVVAELLKGGYPVRAMVHREDARSVPGIFADEYLVMTGVAGHLGVFPWIFGRGRNAPPSNEDIARVAAACASVRGLAARACERRFADVVNGWNY